MTENYNPPRLDVIHIITSFSYFMWSFSIPYEIILIMVKRIIRCICILLKGHLNLTMIQLEIIRITLDM